MVRLSVLKMSVFFPQMILKILQHFNQNLNCTFQKLTLIILEFILEKKEKNNKQLLKKLTILPINI